MRHARTQPQRAAARPAQPRKAIAPRVARHAVRIVGGRLRSRLLPVLNLPGLRPTPDRVRETLFNWLGQDLAGWRVADPFAGTGALGLEAASRGAARVQMCEINPKCTSHLREQLQILELTDSVTVHTGDALRWLQGLPDAGLDLLLLDPPYAAPVYASALAQAARVLKPNGWLYLEAGQAWSAAHCASLGWSLLRQCSAGQVHAHLLRRAAVQPGVAHAAAAAPGAPAAQPAPKLADSPNAPRV